MNKDIKRTPDANEGKSKAKIFWKHFGLMCIALGLAVVTFFVISLK